MKIVILGAGAMGSVFGGKLYEAGHQVTLIDIWQEHVDAINKSGLILEGIGGKRSLPVRAVSDPRLVGDGPVDLMVVFVKSTATEKAVAEAVPLVDSDTVILTLQNGLGNGDIIARSFNKKQVVIGVTSHGATLLAPGHVRHAGQGLTVIGGYDEGDSKAAQRISLLLNAAGIQTQVSSRVSKLIWDKLVVNVGINPVTALLQVPNGYLLQLPAAKKLMETAVAEAVRVATSLGISMEEKEAVSHCCQVAKDTELNLSSMLQDVKKKRRTEIDFINGAITRLGLQQEVETPVNRVLTLLIKALEESWELENTLKNNTP